MVSNFMVLGQPVTSEVRSNTPNLVNWDSDLADAIKPTKASESLSKWLRTVQITLLLTLGEKGHKGSS